MHCPALFRSSHPLGVPSQSLGGCVGRCQEKEGMVTWYKKIISTRALSKVVFFFLPILLWRDDIRALCISLCHKYCLLNTEIDVFQLHLEKKMFLGHIVVKEMKVFEKCLFCISTHGKVYDLLSIKWLDSQALSQGLSALHSSFLISISGINYVNKQI